MSAIGIDLGGTAIKYAVVEQNGHILWEDKKLTEADKPTAHIVQNIIDAVLEARKQAIVLGTDPVCVGIGTPGVVDVKKGIVLGAADNLTGWVQLPLADLVSKATGLPVFIDNDANMMGLGEYAYGGNRDCEHLIFITIGTGIGGAIFINGQLHRGYRYAGGELGLIMMTYEGKDGYWEDFASTAAMVRQYKEKAQMIDPKIEINGKYIVDQYLKKEPLAVAVFKEHTRLVGYGLAGYINIFNPEKIVIGGGISEAGDVYIKPVDAAAQKSCSACFPSSPNKAGKKLRPSISSGTFVFANSPKVGITS